MEVDAAKGDSCSVVEEQEGAWGEIKGNMLVSLPS